MLPFFLFCIYLTTNLGSLLLASAAQKKKTKFLNSSAVALSEAIKCAMSLLMIWAARRGTNAQSMLSTIYRALFADPRQMLKDCARPYARPMVRPVRFAETEAEARAPPSPLPLPTQVCIPAMLYTMQNNVIYMALAHLDAVTFQIVYQLKIVAALVSHRPSASHRTFALTFASTAGAHAPPSPLRSVTASSLASASARCDGSRCSARLDAL